jgi:hypothetical protein
VGRCKVCGRWKSISNILFIVRVLDKRGPRITLQEELTDLCDCDFCSLNQARERLRRQG